MKRVLNNLGIYDDYDMFEHEHEVEQNYDERQEYMYNDICKEDKDIIRNKKNVKKATTQDFTFFINDIYRNCIKYDILPSIVLCWMRDIIDTFKELDDSCIQKNVLNSDDHTSSDNNNKENKNIPLDLDCIQHNALYTTNNSRLNNSLQQKQNHHSNFYHNSNVKRVPFVSHISGFIAQSKREYFDLEDSEKKIENKIKSLRLQKIHAEKNIHQINQKENKIISYIDFF